jgi:hypothetical protein
MLLLPDAVMATKARSVKGWIRLLALGAVFSIWLALNAHAILFTAQGGVGWIAPSLIDSYAHVGDNVMAALHPQWLAFTLGLGVCLLVIRWHQNKLCWWGEDAWQLWVLATLCILYLVFAALIVSRAGMEHPRYFVFIVPFVLVLMGLILAELHHKGLAVGAIFTIMILAQPNATLIAREGNDDFRSMGWAASDGSNDKTYFLYPWEPNRNLYRLYLQRFLGYDPIANMISVSSKEQAAQVCEKITGLSHVVALGHAVSHAVIDTVYAQCGENWPMREQKDFHQTFSEHWR